MFMSKTDNAAQIDQSLDTEFVSLPRLAALSKVKATRLRPSNFHLPWRWESCQEQLL